MESNQFSNIGDNVIGNYDNKTKIGNGRHV